mgnify:CR=1 FL=1
MPGKSPVKRRPGGSHAARSITARRRLPRDRRSPSAATLVTNGARRVGTAATSLLARLRGSSPTPAPPTTGAADDDPRGSRLHITGVPGYAPLPGALLVPAHGVGSSLCVRARSAYGDGTRVSAASSAGATRPRYRPLGKCAACSSSRTCSTSAPTWAVWPRRPRWQTGFSIRGGSFRSTPPPSLKVALLVVVPVDRASTFKWLTPLRCSPTWAPASSRILTGRRSSVRRHPAHRADARFRSSRRSSASSDDHLAVSLLAGRPGGGRGASAWTRDGGGTPGATDAEVRCSNVDVTRRHVSSWNLWMCLVILTSAADSHAHGMTSNVTTAQEAAEALLTARRRRRVLALHASALIGTGILSVPILAGSCAYAIAEAAAWRGSLDNRPKDARRFYAVVAVKDADRPAARLRRLQRRRDAVLVRGRERRPRCRP